VTTSTWVEWASEPFVWMGGSAHHKQGQINVRGARSPLLFVRQGQGLQRARVPIRFRWCFTPWARPERLWCGGTRAAAPLRLCLPFPPVRRVRSPLGSPSLPFPWQRSKCDCASKKITYGSKAKAKHRRRRVPSDNLTTHDRPFVHTCLFVPRHERTVDTPAHTSSHRTVRCLVSHQCTD
jgi:hypothetical protein